MKQNPEYSNPFSPHFQRIPVRFEYTHPTAIAVAVAGTFNDWHPTTKTMHPLGNGQWLKETALPPGIYEYCFVVDDQWLTDPLAADSIPNSFGGANSILSVPIASETIRPAQAEYLPLKNPNN